MYDIQQFIDRITETENLTAELEDSEAKWLLNWGIGQLDTLLDGAEDEELASERVGNLMRLIRRLNRVCADPASIIPEDVTDLLDRQATAFGESRTVSEEEAAIVAGQLASMSVLDALIFLVSWLRPGQSS
jgi:hypothetical protein